MNTFAHKQPAASRLGTVSAVSDADKKTLLAFAKHYNFEYFDTKQAATRDGTPLVRGVTLGDSESDAAYLFGAYEDYDITCVQRIKPYQSEAEADIWLTVAISLHTAVYLPHLLLGEGTELRPLLAELAVKELKLYGFSARGAHNQVSQQFEVYAPDTHNSTVEHIISPSRVNSLMEAIPRAIIEVLEDTIHISVKQREISEDLLVAMLQQSVRFARYVDKKMGAA